MGFFCLLAGVCAWARVAAEGGVGDLGGGAGREVAAQGASTALRCSQDGRAAKLASLTGVRCAQTGGGESEGGSALRAPPVLLRASPPTRRPHPTPHPLPGGSGGVEVQGERGMALALPAYEAPNDCKALCCAWHYP